MTKVGYIRSSKESYFDLQKYRLNEYGIDKIFVDDSSSFKECFEKKVRYISELKKGDVVVCCSIDRLCASAQELYDVINLMKSKECNIEVLDDLSLGKKLYNELSLEIIGLCKDIQNKNRIEITKNNLSSAIKKGKKIGRPEGMTKKSKERYEMIKILQSEGYTKTEIARKLKTCRMQINKIIKENEEQ